MNVLSLFDGISCGQVALKRAGIKVDKYFASEIDKYAIQITRKNFPDTIFLGNVNDIDFHQFTGNIDLLLGGSPCQDLSIAKKDRKGLEGEKSGLFWRYVDALTIAKPTFFLFENVASMKAEDKERISEILGVAPIFIDSSLVSAQQRKRLYWTNIPNVILPEDKKIFLKDIVLSDAEPIALHNLYGGFKEKYVRVFEDKSPTIRTASGGGHIPSFIKKNNKIIDDALNLCFDNLYETQREARVYEGKSPTLRSGRSGLETIDLNSLILSKKALEYMDRQVADGRTHWDFGYIHDIRDEKSKCLLANLFKGVPYNVFKDWDCIRKFHPIECERLMTLEDNYTAFGTDQRGLEVKISDTQRYKAIGNGWTVDVISWILSFI